MTVKVTTWVFDHSEATGSDRLVLLALADHADDETWSCWPSMQRIARKARLSESTTRRALQSLAASGRIRIERNGGLGYRDDRRPNLYFLLDEVSGCAPVDDGVSKPPPRGVKKSPNGVSAVTPKPSIEPKYINKTQSLESSGARFPEPRNGCAKCDGGMILHDNNTAEQCSCMFV